jgi:hypothetical protein
MGKRVVEHYKGHLPWDRGEEKWARDHFKSKHGTGTQHLGGSMDCFPEQFTAEIPLSAARGSVLVHPKDSAEPILIPLGDIPECIKERGVGFFFTPAFAASLWLFGIQNCCLRSCM